LETIIYNINRQAENLKLYEFGKSYQVYKNNNSISEYIELNHLSLWATGLLNLPTWNKPKQSIDFFFLKEKIENIFSKIGINHYEVNKLSNNSIYDYGIEYVVKNEIIANTGKLKKAITKLLDITSSIFYGNIEWDKIIKILEAQNNIKVTELPKYPIVRRDLALLIDIDKNITFEDIKNIASNVENKLLKNIVLFDIYQGDKIEQGKKSYAISFYFQDANKTLTDNQIEKIMTKLIDALSEKINAKIR
jgi:phenylalanyl-tRNA synthetase beta chain